LNKEENISDTAMKEIDLSHDPRFSLQPKEGDSTSDWKSLLRGAMSDETADFAVHPCDEECACWMVRRAAMAKVSKKDMESELDAYLKQKVKNPEYLEKTAKPRQFGLFRKFFSRQTRPIKGAWIIYRRDCSNVSPSIVHILRSRLTPERALDAACLIYEATELSTTAKFLCAKRNLPKPYPIKEWRVSGGNRSTRWPGEYHIGENPTYVLRLAKSVKCPKGFRPDGKLDWKPYNPPDEFA